MVKSLSKLARLVAWVAVGAVAATGCVGPQRAIEKAVYCAEAKHAYKRCGDCGLACEFSRHYERGWRRGYVAVAVGRGDCPPPLPPHPYLGKKYQSPQGQELVSLWFKGWEEGAAAARSCGRGPQVLTHDVGCQDGCQQACLHPGPGVLPDAALVVAIQAASYETPAVAPPTPTAAPRPEDVPAVEVDAPETDIESTPIPLPTEASAPQEWSEVRWTSWPAVGGLEYPTDSPTTSSPSAYQPSETTPLAFPSEPSSLPPVAIRRLDPSTPPDAKRVEPAASVPPAAPAKPAPIVAPVTPRPSTSLAFPVESSQPTYRPGMTFAPKSEPLRLPSLGWPGAVSAPVTPVPTATQPKATPPAETLTPVSLPKAPTNDVPDAPTLELPEPSGELPPLGSFETGRPRRLALPEIE